MENGRKALNRRRLPGSYRYRRELAGWVGARSGSVGDLRKAVRRLPRSQRHVAMQMAAFFAIGELNIDAGMDPASDVGHHVNAQVYGDAPTINKARALVRMLRRLSRLLVDECSECGERVRKGVMVCTECENAPNVRGGR